MPWQYSDGDPSTGASNTGGVGKKLDLSRYLAPSHDVNTSTAKCNTLSCDVPWQVVTLITYQRSLLMAQDDDKVFMTRSLNVTPKTTQQHLVVRSGKSEA